MIKQTVLPFKVEITKDTITAHAGLALVGEFAVGIGMFGGSRPRVARTGQWRRLQSV